MLHYGGSYCGEVEVVTTKIEKAKRRKGK